MNGITAFQLLGKLAIDGVDETKKALKEVSESGEDAKDKLSISFQDIGNKAGELGKKMALGLAGVVAGAVAGVEATREFRQDLGKLESSFSLLAEGGAKQGTETFKELYAVLGEDDTAIEAANNLVALTGNTQHLGEWTNILTGVYASFGDSLPIEGLAEASNETARVGTVTGGLADALNWAGVSEDEFNAKLEKCNTTAEREKLIRETLTELYGESASTYKDVNSSVMANNTAQAELNLKMAETMEKLEPLVTEAKLFLAEVLLKAQPLITWVIDNINILAPLILGFMGALFALNIASKIMALIPILTSLNAVLTANPIGAIIMAVAAVIAIIVVLWNKCEWFRDLVKGLWEELEVVFDVFVKVFKIYITLVINYIKMWINAFKSVVSGIKTGVENIKNFFSNLKENVISTVNNLKEGVSNTFNKIKTAITTPIEKARDVVKGVVEKIKGFFKFNVSLPKIKLPRFSIKPSGWKIGDLLEGSIPKLGIEWYAKAVRNPMLLDRPTAFGLSPNGNLRVGGEAGSEIVGGTNTIMGMISDAVSGNSYGVEEKLDRVISLLTNYLPTLGNQKVVLSTGELVGAMVNPMDRALGELAVKKGRGY